MPAATEKGNAGVHADNAPVAVIIPAWNAAGTVRRAIASALAERAVGAVVVIDDASTDGTAAAAGVADDGSGRLRIIRLEHNRGPAAARNIGIAATDRPLVAVLDSDDHFLAGRFAPLLARSDWDAIADNLVFVSEADAPSFNPASVAPFDAQLQRLELAGFVLGNISTPDRPRGELGFAKPVLRRAFLDHHGLRYDETLRLGEDYVLYARLLARGGTFLTSRRCGYVAVERPTSLSGRHAKEDLLALAEADRQLLAEPGLEGAGRAAIARHRAHILAKARHRAFLETRRSHGMMPALWAALRRPGQFPALVGAIARDKWQGLAPPPRPEVRYLFS